MKVSRLTLVTLLFLVFLVLCAITFFYSSANNFVQPLSFTSRLASGFINNTLDYVSHLNDASTFHQIVNRTSDYTVVSQTKDVSHQSLSGDPLPANLVTKTTSLLSTTHQPLLTHPVRDMCHLSDSTLRNWKRGLITELSPRIKKDCHKLLLSDKQQKTHVSQEMEKWKSLESDQQWLTRMTGNCSNVIREFEQASFYISEEEINFPIAYIFVIYTNPRQIIRLLKAIYRPA